MSLVLHGPSRERSQLVYRRFSPYKLGEYGNEERPDEWIYYASGIRPYYDGLNGLIGQIAGLLILGQAKGCFEYYISLAQEPLERVKEYQDGLYSIHVPVRSREHYLHVILAAELLFSCCKTIKENMNSAASLNYFLTEMVSDLKQASTLLRCASDQALKMQTINTSLSCACCQDAALDTQP
ncbi:hypothetical protein Sant_P0360 (plasmid) [Sodalis praecaptivus]|uniref:Uncharacterized protein n=2 Tax=Sodalis praecaptivus TaxID=1239307 RepID=W0I4M1_9GAMM|nr:hypothetical protein Sant_P0360 [Sodalis praecaptivus]